MKVDITRTDDHHLIVDARGQTLTVHRGVHRDEATDGVTASELVLGGLGACMLGTALTFARNTDMDLDDIQVTMEADSTRHPERLETIRVAMTVTGRLTEKQLASLSRVAARCKIHNTFEDPPNDRTRVAARRLNGVVGRSFDAAPRQTAPIDKRDGSDPISTPATTIGRIAAEPVEWQSMTEATNPPYTIPSNAVCDGHGSKTVSALTPTRRVLTWMPSALRRHNRSNGPHPRDTCPGLRWGQSSWVPYRSGPCDHQSHPPATMVVYRAHSK